MNTPPKQSRLAHEIEHGKKLMSGGAERIWNWASPAGKKRSERRAGYLVSVGKIGPGDFVLEIGCGTGLFTKKIQDATGARVVAIDLSEELLAIARKEVPNADFRIADAMDMPFKDAEFAVVCGSSILHHLDMLPALKEALRVLKPGGRLVFAEPNMLNPQILIQKNVPAIKRWLGDSPDETAIVRWRIADDMRAMGYANVRIFPYDFLHPSTPAALIPIVDGIGRIAEKVPLVREVAGSVIMYAEKPARS